MAEAAPATRLLLVGESFSPDNTPRANRWSFFARGLAARGHRIEVVSRHFCATPLDQALAAKPVAPPPSFAHRALRRAFSMLVFEHHVFWAVRRFVALARRRRQLAGVDAVVAYALPLSGVVLGYALARLLRKPLVAEYGDPVDINPARRPPLLERIANRRIMRRAERLVVTNRNYADFAARTYGRPVDCLPPVASLPAPGGDAGERAAARLSELAGAAPSLFYAGMFYEGIRSGVPLLQALAGLPDAPVFVHAGTPYARAAGSAAYRSLGYIDQPLVPHFLYWSDAVLYFANDSAWQTPSKVVEVALVAPVVIAIGSTFSDLETDLLALTRTLYVANDPDAITAALATLREEAAAQPRSAEDYARRVEALAQHNRGVLDRLAGMIGECVAGGAAR